MFAQGDSLIVQRKRNIKVVARDKLQRRRNDEQFFCMEQLK